MHFSVPPTLDGESVTSAFHLDIYCSRILIYWFPQSTDPRMNAYRQIARNQRLWATLAKRDEKYNRGRARVVRSPVLKRSYLQEARWDQFWANRRLRIARAAEKRI